MVKTAASSPTSTWAVVPGSLGVSRSAGRLCQALSPLIKPKVTPLRECHVESVPDAFFENEGR
jgi:hypothetical protein